MFFNKLEEPSSWGFGFGPDLRISSTTVVSPAGHGGEGTRWSGAHGIRGFGDGDLLREYANCSWQCVELMLLSIVLWKSELTGWFGVTPPSSSIKFVLCRYGGHGLRVDFSPASRHGGERGGDLRPLAGSLPSLC